VRLVAAARRVLLRRAGVTRMLDAEVGAAGAKQTTTTPADVVVCLTVMRAKLRRARLERES